MNNVTNSRPGTFDDETPSANESTRTGSIEKTWTNLLLDWVNACARPARPVRQLSGAAAAAALCAALGRYARAPPLAAAELEPFLCRQYSQLSLNDIGDDDARKMYVVSSVALLYCATRAGGAARAAAELCARLPPRRQLLALLFCERLGPRPRLTLSSVDTAIREACESVDKYEANPEGIPISRILSDATPSDFSRQSDGDATIALKCLRSSVIALQTSADVSVASSSRGPPAPASASGASSAVLTEGEILLESGDIVISRKQETDFGDPTELYAEEKHVMIPSRALAADSDTDTTVITDMNVNVQVRKDGNFPYGGGASRRGSPRRVSFSRTDSFSPPPSRFRNPFPSRMLYYLQQRGYQYYPNRRREWKPRNFLKCMTLSCGCVLVVLLFVLSFSSYITISAGRLKQKTHVTASSLASSVNEDVDNISYAVITQVEDILKSRRSAEKQKILWECRDSVCQKVKGIESKPNFYPSSSRCNLLCGGPQIWPLPTERVQFGKALVALSSRRLRHAVTAAPSDEVRRYLVQAFQYFYKDVVQLENLGKKSSNRTLDLPLKTMNIRMSVERDPDPRLRLTTDEAYLMEMGTDGDRLMVHLSGGSFCGVRHALESLSQMLMVDRSTGYLITLNGAVVRDAPGHRYRGLMLDTARNYIPIPDIVRTIDAMASVKLNTFHWRITDATSFPLLLPEFSDLFEHGAYERSMAYTREDVADVAARAAARGVRVLLELAAPPAGRAWRRAPLAACAGAAPCRDPLCLRLNLTESLFDVLQHLYSEILEMTSVDDVFHLSNGDFSLTNCHFSMEDRKGFLSKALEALELANHGVLPALPIVWYSSQAVAAAGAARGLGVQLPPRGAGPAERALAGLRVVQSTKWDLSCEMKNQRCYRYRTWQEMYGWRSWKAVDALSVEGGEAMLWTDLVNSDNLDMVLWPRAAAVAERLWAADARAGAGAAPVHVRLDHHVARLRARGVAAAPAWARGCGAAPRACLAVARAASALPL